MYIMSMAALIKLRQSEPQLVRPFRAPLYPVAPMIALGLSVLFLITMIWFNPQVFTLFVVLFGAGLVVYRLTQKTRMAQADDPMLQAAN